MERNSLAVSQGLRYTHCISRCVSAGSHGQHPSITASRLPHVLAHKGRCQPGLNVLPSSSLSITHKSDSLLCRNHVDDQTSNCVYPIRGKNKQHPMWSGELKIKR